MDGTFTSWWLSGFPHLPKVPGTTIPCAWRVVKKCLQNNWETLKGKNSWCELQHCLLLIGCVVPGKLRSLSKWKFPLWRRDPWYLKHGILVRIKWNRHVKLLSKVCAHWKYLNTRYYYNQSSNQWNVRISRRWHGDKHGSFSTWGRGVCSM